MEQDFRLALSINELDKEIQRLRFEKKKILSESRKLGRVNNEKIARMSKQEIIDATWKMPELTDGLYKLLEDEGFPTGSDIYGRDEVIPNDYDWCIIMPPHVFDGYAVGTDQDYWVDDGFCTVYTHYNGNLLNIICFSNYDLYRAWYYATETMRHLNNFGIRGTKASPYIREDCSVGGYMNASKYNRVRLFRALVDMFWPVKKVSDKKRLTFEQAMQFEKCMECGREAINFTHKEAKDFFKANGICQRCAPNSAKDSMGYIS